MILSLFWAHAVLCWALDVDGDSKAVALRFWLVELEMWHASGRGKTLLAVSLAICAILARHTDGVMCMDGVIEEPYAVL